jgi:hypothetical protein
MQRRSDERGRQGRDLRQGEGHRGKRVRLPARGAEAPGEVPADVLDACVDDATVGCYSGNIEIVKP